ncbi:MAG: imidazole glycerol phosphate synthase subunit HisH [Lachnospiraceae bacterium]|nr:imidazole glycerol phosphate synthase subunit HisH [Lachnospiraceae bacterium]
MSVAVIDYDAGNLKSVEKALVRVGESPVLTRDPQVILAADRVILPGVGNFGDAADKLHEYGLKPVIDEVIRRGTPFLGICLGMQMLFEDSEEAPGAEGLGVLPGRILRIPKAEGLKIPHMGWNSLQVKEGAALFRGLPAEPYVYFVHSYYLKAGDPDDVAARTNYSVDIDASVERGNLFGCQFHPEKSGDVGLHILEKFLKTGRRSLC